MGELSPNLFTQFSKTLIFLFPLEGKRINKTLKQTFKNLQSSLQEQQQWKHWDELTNFPFEMHRQRDDEYDEINEDRP